MAALKKNLNTPAWKTGLAECTGFLKETCAGENEGSLSYDKLVIVALLYCQDQSKPKAKAEALYNLLQEGGKEKHEMITAMDKDWKDVLSVIFTIATFEAASAAG